MRFARRAGTSIRQRVISRGRGAAERSAVPGVGRVGVRQEGEHARLDASSLLKIQKQALLPLENNSERGERVFEERVLEGVNKKAAPCTGDYEAIIVISDEEERQEEQMVLASSTGEPVLHLTPGESRLRQFIPRTVSPMLRKVQEWEVKNQNIFKASEQIEFVDSSGLVMRGTISVRQVVMERQVWHRTSARREGATRSGLPDYGEGNGSGPLHEGVLSTSRGAGVAKQEVIDDVLPDYEEEEEAEEIFSGQRRAVQRGTTRVVACEADKKADQSNHWVGRDRQVSFTGKLPRGENNRVQSSKVEGSHAGLDSVKRIMGTDMGIQTGVSDKSDGIDVSIQMGCGEAPSKTEVKQVLQYKEQSYLIIMYG
ncbi:hypothetical protein NDU88_003223 [Pleurodeles waltl]|uniref:Uncharacterized protein n=1 Tax=Pleurodeles waltl TaxID=8319 RepID=A0AAV7W5D4_PLEWA|nr:hypothetical protein NDU88_003223 [Pleurodeles waltl]